MISFFTEKNTLGAEIRGRQIAAHLGNTCIHIKPRNLDYVKDNDWVDVSDGAHLPRLLKTRPKINVIAHSVCLYDFLKNELLNKLAYIPQQHLNWENIKRNKTEINTCGYIGALTPVSEKIYKEVGEKLKENNWNFIFCHDYKTREDAMNFYKSIDLLVIGVWKGDGIYKTPAKIINAASFGIPSVVDPLEGYEEFEGFYVRADNLETMIEKVNEFKNENYYKQWSEKIVKEAEKYHISKIVEKYKQL